MLFTIAVALVLVAGLAVRRRFAAAGVGLALTASTIVLAVRLEALLVGAIVKTGGGVGNLNPRAEPSESIATFVSDRLAGVWRVVLDGGYTGGFGARRPDHLITIALLLVALAGVGLRLRGRQEALVVGTGVAVTSVLVAVVLYEVTFSRAPLDPLAGLLAAWPIAVVGLVATPWRQVRRHERDVAFIVVLFAGAVFLTQYRIGGAVEWGGRFLAPVVVPVAALVAVALSGRLGGDRPWRQRWLAVGTLTVLAIVPVAWGVIGVGGYRARRADFYRELGREAHPVIVVGDFNMARVPLNAWPIHEKFSWYLTGSDKETDALLAELEKRGVENVTLLKHGRAFQGSLQEGTGSAGSAG